MNNRSIVLPAIFANDAQTTIPASPTKGTSYRDTAIDIETIEQGWPYNTTVLSEDFNQFLFLMSSLIKHVETQGVLSWSPDTTYQIKSICFGSDGLLYSSLQDSNFAHDPTTSPTYWELLLANFVDKTSAQTIAGVKTFTSTPVLSAGANCGGQKITNLAAATANGEAVRYEQVMLPGVIQMYGGASAPSGWLLCNGAAVSRTTYAALYAIIGEKYGAGDSSTTFNIPNFKGKVPVGLNASDTSFDVLGETGGEKTHTLTIPEMPSHTHVLNDLIRSNNDSGSSAEDAAASGTAYDKTTGATGGGGAHNNLQPYLVVNYIIKT